MNDRIKVLYILGSMHNGGTEVFVMNFFRELDKKEIDCSFLVVQGNEEYYKQEIENQGAAFYHLSSLTNGKYKENVKSIRAFFKNHHYDIVHIHSCSLRFMYIMARETKKAHAGIIVGHAHSVGEPRGTIIDTMARKLLRANISKLLDYGMACSSDSAEGKYTQHFIASEKFMMIPNAIDTCRYSYDKEKRTIIRKKYCLENKYLVGIIGRLEKWKNQSFLMEAIQVANQKQEVYMMAVGDGDMREDLERKAKTLEIEDKVIFTGSVHNAYDYYSAMDLFCLPSYAEGFPFVLVEAQANGLKCLISDEITRETDISKMSEFLPINDCQIWADRIIANLDSRLSDEAIDLVRREYDIKYAAKQLQDYYKKIMANK